MKLKVVSRISVLLLVIGMLTLAFNVQKVESEPVPLLSLEPNKYTVRVGDSFNVSINIWNVTDMYGCEVKLGYNLSVLHAVRVYPTDITDDAHVWVPVNSTGNFNFDKHPVINNTRTYAPDHAYVWIGVGGFAIFNGSGAVFIIEFTAIGARNSSLHLWDTEVADHLADPIVHACTDGWVLVIGVGDVNGDMTVNVLDLILVLINVGPVPPKPPECDINCDDKVNVLDIILCLVNAGPV